MIAFVKSNWLALLGLSVGIGGIVAAWINRHKTYRICYQKSSVSIIGGALPEDVRILVGGDVASQLVVTTIVLWNSGCRALKKEDVVDPITVAFREGDRIFRYRILKASTKSNRSDIKVKNAHTLALEFRYLDPDDGMSIEVLHDSQEIDPCIEGTIIENKSGFIDAGKIAPGRFNMRKIRWKIAGSVGVFALGSMIWTMGHYTYSSTGIVMMAAGCSWVGQIIGRMWRNRRRCPQSLTVSGIARQ
ncbi:MAG: hypothetical protein OXQ31_10695 [Spirochaetaceae bacterium]|nr:hypothetical protein [Spirochaetaceae bacterium]